MPMDMKKKNFHEKQRQSRESSLFLPLFGHFAKLLTYFYQKKGGLKKWSEWETKERKGTEKWETKERKTKGTEERKAKEREKLRRVCWVHIFICFKLGGVICFIQIWYGWI
jgi:hypothetical protein